MPANDGRFDFDFIIGEWVVNHQRLNERLVGCKDWSHFSGRSKTTKILSGLGNLEDNYLELPQGGYSAIAIRSFDADKGHWSIWWLDGRSPSVLDKPVVGKFVGDVGEFYAEDSLNGRSIRIRFLWKRLGPNAARWEQAFTESTKEDWETNWTMDFSRVS